MEAAGRLETNKQLVRKFYAHVFGAQDPGAVRDFVAEDYHQLASEYTSSCRIRVYSTMHD